jgi:hypothetical protein
MPIEETLVPTVSVLATPTPSTETNTLLASVVDDIDEMWVPEGAPNCSGIFHTDRHGWGSYPDMSGQQASEPMRYPGESEALMAYVWREPIGCAYGWYLRDLTVFINYGNPEGEAYLMPLRPVTDSEELKHYPQVLKDGMGGLVVGPADPKKWIPASHVQKFFRKGQFDESVVLCRTIFRDVKPGLYLMFAVSNKQYVHCSAFQVIRTN